MAYIFLVWTVASIFIFLLGVSIGHTFFTLKMRKEENKKRELELALLNKHSQAIQEDTLLSEKLEELIYKVTVKKEIDNIIGKKDIN
jgi:hypothetical protein